MAITRDQLSSLTANGSTGSTAVTITFGTNPTAGSSVIAALGINFNAAGSITSVVDNGTTPTTFTQDVTKTGTANHISYIYRADNITLPSSGSYVITVTLSVTGASVSMGAASYLGKLAGGPAATNTGTATSGTVTTNSVTPTAGGSLFAATFQNNSSNTADNVTLTNGNFSSRLTESNGGTAQVYGFADAIEAGTGGDACTWTVATTTDTYSSAIAVYSPAATTQPDLNAIRPGLTWLDLFKPGLPKPRPYLVSSTALEQGALAVTLPAPVTSLAGTAVLPLDQPQIQPGQVWLDMFKPGMPRARPPVPPSFALPGENGPLNIVLPAPVTSLAGTAVLPLDMPQVQPGPTWLDLFKPGMPKPRPPVPPPPRVSFITSVLAVILPAPVTSLSGGRLRAPENLGAVLTESTPDGRITRVTADATCTLADYDAKLVLANFGASLTGWTMQTAPLNLNEFNDVTINIAVTQNGSPYNLTGVTLNLLLKTQAGTPDANALIFSSGGGSPAITITNASGGLATAVIPNNDLDAETYNFYRLDVVNAGLTNTTLYGPITWTTL